MKKVEIILESEAFTIRLNVNTFYGEILEVFDAVIKVDNIFYPFSQTKCLSEYLSKYRILNIKSLKCGDKITFIKNVTGHPEMSKQIVSYCVVKSIKEIHEIPKSFLPVEFLANNQSFLVSKETLKSVMQILTDEHNKMVIKYPKSTGI